MRAPFVQRPPGGQAHENSSSPLSPDEIEAIRQFDTCTVANAIERFGVRLRNEGFTRPGLRPLTGGAFARLLGYAATCRIRSSDPPMTGKAYLDRTDWWDAVEVLPLPRVAAIQDMDAGFGAAAAVGEVHAAILKALRCDGVITNGAVRDLPAVSAMQFAMFAPHPAVSHAYAHIVDYGEPVEIFGLEIEAGDLLYADCHGVLSIPLEIAAEIPRVAAELRAKEQRIIDFCRSPEFSAEGLLETIKSNQ